MKTKFLLIIAALIFFPLSVYASGLNDKKPASDFAGDYNMLVTNIEGKVIQPAGAIPHDKMSWNSKGDN